MSQLTLDDAPLARATDPQTSHDAPNRDRLSAHRLAALNALALGDATDFELEARTGIKQTSVGKRRGELVRMGYVENTGLRRLTPSGSTSIVWGLTDAGREFHREQA